MNLKPGQKVYLMGVCGTAMASLAGIFKEMGFQVAGSDQNVYPPMSTMLENLNIPIFNGYRAENLKEFQPDFVIVGNVISRSNPEAEYLLSQEIPYTSLPQAMGEFVIGSRDSYVVSGTHGKTTTSSLLAWVLESLGKEPGFLIGGLPLNFKSSFRPPQKDIFVIEGDEYDTAFFDKVPKFVHYKPKHVILTSIEFDHADIYKDLDQILQAFRRLLELIPEDGTLVYNAQDKNIESLLKYCRGQKVSYGFESGDYTLSDRSNVLGRNQFRVFKKDGDKKRSVADLALKVFGPHNTMNALGVFALMHTLGFEQGAVLSALASFKGVKRRQEILLENKDYALIEDFAHHPTAVRLTIEAMKEKYPDRRLLAVFEPRSATSRRKYFQDQFEEAFSHADALFLSVPYEAAKIPEGERFSSKEVVDHLKASGHEAFLGENAKELVSEIERYKSPGDVVLVMSNGGFDGIYGQLRSVLDQSNT
ncbi:MAG: UDP-N-acetylmuramate:L-alanyl-gamma-D-glutamyl-meso-diaminopimelate ligase [Bdellovibrionaceae bacterium]|nr:UDP-N-acetylmuramate:L-alanyl-gamma-D-glutamyl-meso-diaminopimelate ligase [Pseudobdellovibrionaceae bacterium]|tara:strand:- start:318 stop:1748 length:1431 start_codon:yes stop_codon:yes gene_type:complete